MDHRFNSAVLLFSAFYLTSCDFVDSKSAELHEISLPSYLPTYCCLNTIEYDGIIERSVHGQQGVKLDASMKISFDTAAVEDPFTKENHTFTRITTIQTIAEEEVSSTQYITQAAEDATDRGSIFIHAFDAVSQNEKLWITTNNAVVCKIAYRFVCKFFIIKSWKYST